MPSILSRYTLPPLEDLAQVEWRPVPSGVAPQGSGGGPPPLVDVLAAALAPTQSQAGAPGGRRPLLEVSAGAAPGIPPIDLPPPPPLSPWQPQQIAPPQPYRRPERTVGEGDGVQVESLPVHVIRALQRKSLNVAVPQFDEERKFGVVVVGGQPHLLSEGQLVPLGGTQQFSPEVQPFRRLSG